MVGTATAKILEEATAEQRKKFLSTDSENEAEH